MKISCLFGEISNEICQKNDWKFDGWKHYQPVKNPLKISNSIRNSIKNNHAFMEEIKSSNAQIAWESEQTWRKQKQPEEEELPRPDHGSHYGPWCPPQSARGGAWLAPPPTHFSSDASSLECLEPCYVVRFDGVGSFWPSLQSSLISKASKIILLFVHLGLLCSILHKNLKQANI